MSNYYPIHAPGRIYLWPGGYAMLLGSDGGYSKTCCAGHAEPQVARDHGLSRLAEVADRDIAAWAVEEDVA